VTNLHLKPIKQPIKQLKPIKIKKQYKTETIQIELTYMIRNIQYTVAKLDKLILMYENKQFIVNASIIFWEVI